MTVGQTIRPKFMTKEGQISTEILSDELHITKRELALAMGLPVASVSRAQRVKAVKTQSRLREVVEILNRIQPWTGSVAAAFAWYRSQPLPSFGDQTAEDLVKSGHGEAVRSYLSRINAGGHA